MTRANPRIGQGRPALTSLGAVGGPRGVAAGALRILVEFITNYDKENLNQLQSDLNNLNHQQANSAIAEEKRQQRLGRVTADLAEIQRLTVAKLGTQQRSDLKQIEALENSRSKTLRAQGVQQRQIFNTLAAQSGLTKSQVDLIGQRTALTREETVLTTRQQAADLARTRRATQQVQLERQINQVQVSRIGLGQKLQGLAIGAVGGIVGGAVLGVGFALAQQGLEALGSALQDLIDPSRHARDAVKELGDQVNQLADQQKISQLQAASQIVAQFGINPQQGQGQQLSQILAEAAAHKSVTDQIDAERKALDLLTHQKDIEADLRNHVRELVVAEAKANGTYASIAARVSGGLIETINGQSIDAVVTQRLTGLTEANTDAALKNAQALEQQARAAQASAAIASFAQQKFADALQAAVGVQVAGIQGRIERLPTESARTRQLQAAIERAQNVDTGASRRNVELRNIAEERQLILLRQRLRLLGANINLEQYSGKFLLEAIDAKIAALNKQGQAQDRLNQLLDLQYRMSQRITRNQGESIADFLQRRAEEQRHQLAEQANFTRENAIDQLQTRRDQVADEVALAELAQRRKDALQKEGTNHLLRELEKQLAASRKHDAAVLAARRKALQAEITALQKQASDAIKIASIEEQDKLRLAISGIDSITKLSAVAAAIQGTLSARAFIQSFGVTLVASGAITQEELDTILDRLNNTLAAYTRQKAQFSSNAAHELQYYTKSHAFQKGGVVALRNSGNPFGQNVRQGEGGTEIGVILSNRVANILKQQSGGPQQIGPFNMYGSEYGLRDQYNFKKTVKEAVAEALR